VVAVARERGLLDDAPLVAESAEQGA